MQPSSPIKPRDLDREQAELMQLLERSVDPQLIEELERMSLLNSQTESNLLELAVMEGTCYASQE